jgi:hypothetical protein
LRRRPEDWKWSSFQQSATARKGVLATRGQVEVREVFFNPATD